MNHLSLRTPRATAFAILVTSALTMSAVTVTPAQAGDDDETIRQGSCSGSTDWKVTAKHDDGRIELEGEIDSNRNGQTWHWRVRHDGTMSGRGVAVTRGPSGSFEVERRMADLAGTDVFVLRAVNRVTGERCRGTIAL